MSENSSNCDSNQSTFVEVLDEPCHKPFIRNARVNIFVAKLARNNITMYHRHKEDTVYVVMAGSRCRTQLLGADVCGQEYTTGDCFSAEHRLKHIIHRVECLDESPSDAWFVGTEILQPKASVFDIVLKPKQYTPISKVNIRGCRAFRLELASHETTGNHSLSFSGVFISLANGDLEINNEEIEKEFPLSSGTVSKGYVAWFDGPIRFEIRNVGSAAYEAIILLLE